MISPFLIYLSLYDGGTLVDAGALVGALILAQLIVCGCRLFSLTVIDCR